MTLISLTPIGVRQSQRAAAIMSRRPFAFPVRQRPPAMREALSDAAHTLARPADVFYAASPESGIVGSPWALISNSFTPHMTQSDL